MKSYLFVCERYDEVLEFGGMTKQRQFVTESSHSLGSDFGNTGKLLVSWVIYKCIEIDMY